MNIQHLRHCDLMGGVFLAVRWQCGGVDDSYLDFKLELTSLLLCECEEYIHKLLYTCHERNGFALVWWSPQRGFHLIRMTDGYGTCAVSQLAMVVIHLPDMLTPIIPDLLIAAMDCVHYGIGPNPNPTGIL